ncbi:MAG: hypothetical protein GY728_09465 [Phycisphaeraceae bacterium]|nr:hypothetical protein [Phycisphaerae bacterium]MCP4013325.1 hypothetical protein [Phycisphaeraceae bacterium]MDG1360040.1 hypothetical protein [Phycisphaerales bacterium]MCP4796922.1 hypothetical protein [Phycisphaeraceae bacterium]MCP4938086.1 hypothetical protein [Phycisphaeraceae bacterium]|tara:strand:- start:89 stop:847 length:759 start_codon:yes stop_codon:yes gene_type:complete
MASSPRIPLTSALIGALVRITVVVVVIGGMLIAGLTWWTMDRERRLRAEIAAIETRMVAEIARRDAAIARLGRDRRIARLEVVERFEDPDGEGPRTSLLFIELDDAGREIARREMDVPGDVIYVDAWTARFPAESVASADDPFRDRTLVLLRRIYSDRMPPRDGIPIDTPGGVPDGYAGSDEARFEQAIWKRFWTLASDPEAADEAGIRVAQGEAVYKPMRPGESYELRVEAAGGMTLVPVLAQASATTRDP